MAVLLILRESGERELAGRLEAVLARGGHETTLLDSRIVDREPETALAALRRADRVIAVWSPESVAVAELQEVAERAAGGDKLISIRTRRLERRDLPLGLDPTPVYGESEIGRWEAAPDRLFAELELDEGAGEPQTARPTRILQPAGGPRIHSTQALAASPDGRLLASGGLGGGLTIWDLDTGEPVRRLEDAMKSVDALAFSPRGDLLAAGGEDAIVRLWSLGSYDLAARLQGHRGPIEDLAFSPDGRRLVSAGAARLLRMFRREPKLFLWDPATAAPIHDFGRWGQAGEPGSIAFFPDGERLATGGDGLNIWRLEKGDLELSLTSSGSIQHVDVAPDGRTLAVAGDHESAIGLWDWRRQRPLRRLEGHTSSLRCLAFSPDGRWLISGGGETTVRVWEVASGRECRTLVGHEGEIRALTWTPGGVPVTASAEGRIAMWDRPGSG